MRWSGKAGIPPSVWRRHCRATDEVEVDQGGEMSTIAIIAIIIGALILIAILVSMARKAKQRREMAQLQTEAQERDVVHHRDQAQEQRTEAAVAEERAKRKEVEAELHEQRATRREQELDT
jgi:FtsZ-interacting cell division protein ZipA